MFILWFSIGFVFGMIMSVMQYNFGKTPALQRFLPDNPMSWRLISAENCPKDRFYAIITVETAKGIRKYRGNCTVWMDLDRFCRCSTDEECVLADLWREAQYKGYIDG